jgi:hypothetical protein
MEFLGDAFLNIRNQYIIPFVQYGIKRNKIQFWNLKRIITNNIVSITYISKNTFEIELTEEDFLKSSLCEIELFKNKALIQYYEYSSLKRKNSTWAFVSLYYFFFFSITTLMRMMLRGFLYLDTAHVKCIENFYLAMYSNVIKLEPGNYFYSVKGNSFTGNIFITLSNKGEGIHYLSCIQMENIIRLELLPYASIDEGLIYSHLLDLLHNYDSKFPSVLRNKLNYPSESCIYDLECLLPVLDLVQFQKDFKDIFFKIKPINNNTENQIKATSLYSILVFYIVQKLYEEYKNRSKFHKDFQKERFDFINANKLKSIELK